MKTQKYRNNESDRKQLKQKSYNQSERESEKERRWYPENDRKIGEFVVERKSQRKRETVK